MTDAGLIECATEFRAGILDGRSSEMMCAVVSWPLAGFLRFSGVECECVSGDLSGGNHVWIKLDDGRVLDATADQFGNFPPVYLGEPLAIHMQDREP